MSVVPGSVWCKFKKKKKSTEKRMHEQRTKRMKNKTTDSNGREFDRKEKKTKTICEDEPEK